MKENQHKKKPGLFSRLRKWGKDGKNEKEMQRKKSSAMDDEDPFTQRFGDSLTASSEKRRLTISESLAGKGEF